MFDPSAPRVPRVPSGLVLIFYLFLVLFVSLVANILLTRFFYKLGQDNYVLTFYSTFNVFSIISYK